MRPGNSSNDPSLFIATAYYDLLPRFTKIRSSLEILVDSMNRWRRYRYRQRGPKVVNPLSQDLFIDYEKSIWIWYGDTCDQYRSDRKWNLNVLAWQLSDCGFYQYHLMIIIMIIMIMIIWYDCGDIDKIRNHLVANPIYIYIFYFNIGLSWSDIIIIAIVDIPTENIGFLFYKSK